MNNKNILIIIAIAAVIVFVGVIVSTNFYSNAIEYETFKLSDSCALSVPVSNNSTFTVDDGLKTYNDTNLWIMSYNKNDLNYWENVGAEIGVHAALNENYKYNHSYHGKNIYIHPDDNKTIYACLISNNTTGDVVIIMSPDEDILYHVIDSVNFTVDNNVNISKNATDDVASETTVTENSNAASETTNKKTDDESIYEEGYIAENDQDFDYDGDGVGDGSAYHSHEYYVEHGQTEPVTPGGG